MCCCRWLGCRSGTRCGQQSSGRWVRRSVMGLCLMLWRSPLVWPVALWCMALAFVVHALRQLPQCFDQPFGWPMWSLSFPLTAFAALSLRLANAGVLPQLLALLVLALACVVVAALLRWTWWGLRSGELLQRGPDARVIGIEPHAALVAGNAQRPQAGLVVLQGRAEAVPCADASFDMVWMLKSLHHIPDMAQALHEAARVLRPGGWLYVSEPVYAGQLNEIVRLYNDEGPVRAAAQQALDAAVASGVWTARRQWRFVQPVHFADAQDFEDRMMQDAV